MNRMLLTSLCVAIGAATFPAAAHQMPWRPGDARVTGFGHCAKGPCMRRADFGTTKPHSHLRDRTVEPQQAGPLSTDHGHNKFTPNQQRKHP
jgi:hypothetical protein